MQVSTIRSLGSAAPDAAVVGVHPGGSFAAGSTPFTRGAASWLRAELDAAGFGGDSGESAVLTGRDLPVGRLAFVGLGDEADLESMRQAAARGRTALPRADSIATALHRLPIDGALGAVVEGFGLADYRFRAYKSSPEHRPELTLQLLSAGKAGKNGVGKDEEQIERSTVLIESVHLARDLVNEPPAGKGPAELAGRVAAIATEAGMTTEIWDVDRLEAEGMGGMVGVGRGSHRPPVLLTLRHRPRRPRARLVLVGKGIVFDSGGLSIKPAKSMETMKCDMAGAAAVAAAAIATARLGVPVEVVAHAALAENMPGGGAQRPGDVVTARNGKTIEVMNTDAEGRVVLADALSLAAESEPDMMVDVATLTGACKVALGPHIAGIFGPDPDVVETVRRAAQSAGERTWPLPLPGDHRSMIDSAVADMRNTGDGPHGGAIAAALLLAEFVGDVPWAHLDVAGPAWADSADHYIPRGGTGFGVRTLVELAESMR